MGIWDITLPLYRSAWDVVAGDWILYSRGAIAITALGTVTSILSNDVDWFDVSIKSFMWQCFSYPKVKTVEPYVQFLKETVHCCEE